MKKGFFWLLCSLFACTSKTDKSVTDKTRLPIVGTWRLITGVVIEKGDTVKTDYTNNRSFIKIINDTHFAFLQHDLRGGKDSAADFAAGGGTYTLKDSLY